MHDACDDTIFHLRQASFLSLRRPALVQLPAAVDTRSKCVLCAEYNPRVAGVCRFVNEGESHAALSGEAGCASGVESPAKEQRRMPPGSGVCACEHKCVTRGQWPSLPGSHPSSAAQRLALAVAQRYLCAHSTLLCACDVAAPHGLMHGATRAAKDSATSC